MPRSKVTTEAFDRMLEELLDDMTGAALLQVPGLYEVVAEYLNNDVLSALREEEEEAAEEGVSRPG